MLGDMIQGVQKYNLFNKINQSNLILWDKFEKIIMDWIENLKSN